MAYHHKRHARPCRHTASIPLESGGGATKLAILNTLLAGMLIGFPLPWVSMLGWFGVRLSATTFALIAATETTAKKSADTSAAAAGFAAKKALPVRTK